MGNSEDIAAAIDRDAAGIVEPAAVERDDRLRVSRSRPNATPNQDWRASSSFCRASCFKGRWTGTSIPAAPG
jgi:hypothetical protein